MESTNQDIQNHIEQLHHKRSPKRRSAAKNLRKLRARQAGPHVLEALKNELKDKRTWETQYQMVMALGDSGYQESLDFLIEISEQEFDATAVLHAIGNAITTLKIPDSQHISNWILNDKRTLILGGIESLAMNKIVIEDSQIRQIIQYVQKPENSSMSFWVAAAAPGWPLHLTKIFLDHCRVNGDSEDIKKAAKAALKGQYLKWNPL